MRPRAGGASPMNGLITFRAIYMRPEGDTTGSFGLYPEDAHDLDVWLKDHDFEPTWTTLRHPDTDEPLHAWWPVEGEQLGQVEGDRGIRHGDRCAVGFLALQRGGRWEVSFVDAEKVD